MKLQRHTCDNSDRFTDIQTYMQGRALGRSESLLHACTQTGRQSRNTLRAS